MSSLLEGFARAVHWLAYAGVGSLLLAMLVTIADVILRGITRIMNMWLSEPIGLAVDGVVDLVQLFVIAVAFMAIPFAFMTDSHVNIDLFTSRLPKRIEALLQALAAGLSAVFMAAVVFFGWDQASMQVEFGDVSSTLEIPILWYWVPLLAGSACAIVATTMIAVLRLVYALTGLGGQKWPLFAVGTGEE